MKKGQKIALAAVVLVAAMTFLLVWGFRGNTGYQLNISEILRQGKALDGRYLLVEGSLVKGTVQFDSRKIELRFTVTDGKSRMPVVYQGVAPDNLDYPEAQIILKGKYDASSAVFQASEVQTRCPSKYEAADGSDPKSRPAGGRLEGGR